MKTSSKLIIAFGSWIFAMLLFSAIILRVNFSKGVTNIDESSSISNRIPETIQPFKALVLENGVLKDLNKDFVNIMLVEGDKYSADGLSKGNFYYKGDTLFVKNSDKSWITLTVPSIDYIEQQGKIWYLKIEGFNKLSDLNIVGNADTYTSIEGSTIHSLNYKGNSNTHLFIQESNTIDSADLELKKGTLIFKATNKYADLKIDSLENVELSGDILKSIKSIK